MRIEDVRLGYLGDVRSHHCENICALLRGVGNHVRVLEHSLTNESYKYNMRQEYEHDGKSAGTKRLYRMYSQLRGLRDASYRQILHEYFQSAPTDCILAYWGTNPVADIIGIKKYRPETKIILNVLCHPLGLTSAQIAAQNALLRHAASYCDGYVYTSNVMKRYFERHVFRGRSKPYLVMPPLDSRQYFPESRLPPCETHPNIVFLGRMDWWAGQPCDNVLGHVESLLKSGIHVYHSDKTGELPPHDCRHLFRPMPLPELRSFATQFDASLIVYNLDACARDDRFRNTIPDRLVASVSSGIPIALPRSGYDACKELLAQYEAVIEYDTPDGLKRQLSDRAGLQALRVAARENSARLCAEHSLSQLTDFICSIIDG